MTYVESMTNDEARMISTLRAPLRVAAKQDSDSVFVLRHSFVIRHFDSKEMQQSDDPEIFSAVLSKKFRLQGTHQQVEGMRISFGDQADINKPIAFPRNI